MKLKAYKNCAIFWTTRYISQISCI